MVGSRGLRLFVNQRGGVWFKVFVRGQGSASGIGYTNAHNNTPTTTPTPTPTTTQPQPQQPPQQQQQPPQQQRQQHTTHTPHTHHTHTPWLPGRCSCARGSHCRHRRGCGSLLGSTGSGAWHLPTRFWVPYTLQATSGASSASSRLLRCSGDAWVGGLASACSCWLPPSRPGSRCELRCVFLTLVGCVCDLFRNAVRDAVVPPFVFWVSSFVHVPIAPLLILVWGFWWVARGMRFRAFLCRWLLFQHLMESQFTSAPHMRKFSLFFACVHLFVCMVRQLVAADASLGWGFHFLSGLSVWRWGALFRGCRLPNAVHRVTGYRQRSYVNDPGPNHHPCNAGRAGSRLSFSLSWRRGFFTWSSLFC